MLAARSTAQGQHLRDRVASRRGAVLSRGFFQQISMAMDGMAP
jgi:hypothetical protein